jgi:hypothetical protein
LNLSGDFLSLDTHQPLISQELLQKTIENTVDETKVKGTAEERGHGNRERKTIEKNMKSER